MALYDSSQLLNIITAANRYYSQFYPGLYSYSNSGNPFGQFNNFNSFKVPNYAGLFNDVSKIKIPRLNSSSSNSTENTLATSSSTSSLRSYREPSLFSNTTRRYGTNFGSNVVSNARSYLGYKESDGSYKLFTDGRTEAWCADFVTHVVEETCEETGKPKPSGFGSSSVSGLRDWGIQNGCYLQTDNKSNKGDVIAQNVKPGDVVIFKNGISHTGIVESVNSDGSFTTIEGNTSDKVAERHYAANDSRVSGFVQLA